MAMITALFTSLRFKISVFIVVLLLITASIFSLITLQTMNRQITGEVIKRAESLCKSTSALAPYSMLANDVLGMDNIVSKVKEANTDVEYVAVTDTGMKVIAHTDVTKRDTLFHLPAASTFREAVDNTMVYELNSSSGNLFEIHTPIFFNNKQIGNVILGINTSVLAHAQTATQRRILAGLGIMLFLGIGCVIVLSSFITRPIQELSKGVSELKRGRKSKLRIYAHDELGSLTESFNHMAELITRQQAELSASAHELEESYISTVKVLAAAIDARDPYTLGHSTRVAQLSIKIGETLGLSHRELEDLEVASLFHDVGKLKTPDYVLLKEGPLNPLELREMSEHCEHGAAILSRAKSLQKYIPAVRHHHEWFNGEGYPDRLRGEDIPLHAAIISVADSYDAMTSSRPYKLPRAPEEALRELNRYAGKQFDPRIVEIFCQVIDSHLPLQELVSSGG
jgi:putative nucleotidyltransferase with HDIG domain